MRHLRAGLVLEILRKRGVAPAEFGYLCLTVGLKLWIKISQFLFRTLFRHKIFTKDLGPYTLCRRLCTFLDQTHNNLNQLTKKEKGKIVSIIQTRTWKTVLKWCAISTKHLQMVNSEIKSLYLSPRFASKRSDMLQFFKFLPASSRPLSEPQTQCELLLSQLLVPFISIILGQVVPIQIEVKLFLRKHRWLLCASAAQSPIT